MCTSCRREFWTGGEAHGGSGTGSGDSISAPGKGTPWSDLCYSAGQGAGRVCVMGRGTACPPPEYCSYCTGFLLLSGLIPSPYGEARPDWVVREVQVFPEDPSHNADRVGKHHLLEPAPQSEARVVAAWGDWGGVGFGALSLSDGLPSSSGQTGLTLRAAPARSQLAHPWDQGWPFHCFLLCFQILFL